MLPLIDILQYLAISLGDEGSILRARLGRGWGGVGSGRDGGRGLEGGTERWREESAFGSLGKVKGVNVTG